MDFYARAAFRRRPGYKSRTELKIITSRKIAKSGVRGMKRVIIISRLNAKEYKSRLPTRKCLAFYNRELNYRIRQAMRCMSEGGSYA